MPGSITDLGNGKYRLSVSNGFRLDGKQNRSTKTIKASSRRAADKELQKMYLEFCNKGKVSINNRIAFNEFIDIWYDRHEKHNSPNAVSGDMNCIRNRLVPHFGKMKLSKITSEHIIEFFDELTLNRQRLDNTGKQLSLGMIFTTYKILRAILNKAKEWGYICENPCLEIPKEQRPKKIYQKPPIFEQEELKNFLQKLFSLRDNATNTKHKLFFYLSLIDGCRVGEHIALTWNDVDLQAKKIIISKSVYTKDKHTLTKCTKNGRDREVYIDDTAVELLKKHKEYQKRWLNKNKLTNPNGYIFLKTRLNSVEMASRSVFRLWLGAFLKKNHFRHIGVHGFRRMAASYALSNNVPITAVQAMLGHSDIATTNIYLRSLKNSRQDGVEKMSNVFQSMIKLE